MVTTPEVTLAAKVATTGTIKVESGKWKEEGGRLRVSENNAKSHLSIVEREQTRPKVKEVRPRGPEGVK